MSKKGSIRRSNSADNLSHEDYARVRSIENTRRNDFGIGDFLINQNKSKSRGRPTPMHTGTVIPPLPVPSSSKIVEKYTGDKLPPSPLFKETVEKFTPPTIDVRNLPPSVAPPTNTFLILNPQAEPYTKKTKHNKKKKSKGGKNKTKKRKGKKTKKNKKTRK